LPGFGKQKSQIFLALLGKQLGVRPDGWREAAGHYGDEGSYRSAADITGPESLAKVRSFKQEAKRAAKAAVSKRESPSDPLPLRGHSCGPSGARFADCSRGRAFVGSLHGRGDRPFAG